MFQEQQVLRNTLFLSNVVSNPCNYCTVATFLSLHLHSFSPHSEKQKSLNVSGIILPPRVIVGQKGRVTVSIEGRRVDRVQTAWFLNDTPISDTSLAGRNILLNQRLLVNNSLTPVTWVSNHKRHAVLQNIAQTDRTPF